VEDHAKRHARLLLWTLLIIVITVPVAQMGLEHRRRIRWIPGIDGPRNLLDAVLNVGLYIPFGCWMYSRRDAAGRRDAARASVGRAFTAREIGKAVAAAFLLSLFAETSQVFSRSRFPSTTDLLTNTAGAWLGALWASARAAKM